MRLELVPLNEMGTIHNLTMIYINVYVKSARRRKEDHGLCDVHTVLNNQRENKNKTKTKQKQQQSIL